MCFYKCSASIMKGSDGWLLHALNSKHLCVWVCRHHAKWWTPSCMVSQLSLRPWGKGLIQGGTGQNFKIEGEPMCKFLIALDTFVGLNG